MTPDPVFSVYQADVIYYGHDLASYFEAEWASGTRGRSGSPG
jgi:hypothetical protein